VTSPNVKDLPRREAELKTIDLSAQSDDLRAIYYLTLSKPFYILEKNRSNDLEDGRKPALSNMKEMNHEESYRFSTSARVCGTCSDRDRFSPVRREGYNDERSDDVCSVYELHHLNELLLSGARDMLLSNSRVLRSHSVL